MITKQAKLWWEPNHPGGLSWSLHAREPGEDSWVVGTVNRAEIWVYDKHNEDISELVKLPGNNLAANSDILLEAVEKVQESSCT